MAFTTFGNLRLGLFNRFAITLLGVTLPGAIAILMASPAEAKCINRVVNRYPGSTISRLRYGKVSIRVKACSNNKPTKWSYSLNEVVTNGTGKAAALNLRASLGNVKYYPKKSYQRVKTNFEQCFAWKTPLCRTIGVVKFQVWVSKKGNVPRISVRNVSSSDKGFTLYSKP
jgi:hypothetical protein